ncbi:MULTISPECIES: pentapeptide repeat-containing protein [Peribacillus]|uniref:pentapeptide repeat-containing protein n=1 Tax=Peribacillus TaxID=2675229 RepID=UPI001F4D6D0A|nr:MULTISPECIES: pentapeptide repeat-containing protein [unclassified Peribacillus]MCK1981513.1 pentapeptide repeat-containing protein [Peribacillus sp. Aquil_B1]MCK2006740.1 pentapeptide repeat-containing protein [Peribacillus sp. Aquil_B8]
MFNQLTNNDSILNHLRADCENCFGLCCVALPYAKSADFAFDKDGGTPCSNLQSDYRCGIHENLRAKGFRGCTVYECFGAGQKVSQLTYDGNDWRDNPASAKEMFDVFPIMQQLHEMLCYLNEALNLDDAKPLYQDLQAAFEDTEYLTKQSPKSIMDLNVPAHRAIVNDLLLRTSELVRAKVPFKKNKKKQNKIGRGSDLIGAKLRGADLRGANLRGALLIASDLREADMRVTDLIGADFRDADLSGADLTGSFFITQAQINSAKGDTKTKLPLSLSIPVHWR